MIWVLGDAFGHESFEPYFKKNNNIGYCRENFDITGFFTNKFVSHDQNAISRLRNTFAAAIKDKVYLPKYVVIVPDDNILRYVNIAKLDYNSVSMGRLLNSIMSQFTKYVDIQKEHLPKKAWKVNYPQFIWIEAPMNDSFPNNELRLKFNKCMHHISKFHQNTTVLPFKKVWDPQDQNYYASESRRFTANGFAKYWESVNLTIKFVDTILTKKINKKKETKQENKEDQNAQQETTKNKYKWTKDDKISNTESQATTSNHREEKERPRKSDTTYKDTSTRRDHKKYDEYYDPYNRHSREYHGTSRRQNYYDDYNEYGYDDWNGYGRRYYNYAHNY